MANSGALFLDGNSDERSLPVSSELIGTINHTSPSVLKNSHIGIIKRLAKSASDVIIHVQIVRGNVWKISHTTEDYSSSED